MKGRGRQLGFAAAMGYCERLHLHLAVFGCPLNIGILEHNAERGEDRRGSGNLAGDPTALQGLPCAAFLRRVPVDYLIVFA